MEFNLDYLRSQGFFKYYGKLSKEVSGKQIDIIFDKDNLLMYIELDNEHDFQKIYQELKKNFLRVIYFYYYFKNNGKVKVVKRNFSYIFTYNPNLPDKERKKSKEDKLKRFTSENPDILFNQKDVVDKFYLELWKIRLKLAKSIKENMSDKEKLLVVQRFIDRLIFFYFLIQLGIVKIKIKDEEISLDRNTVSLFFEELKNLSDSELHKVLNRLFFEGLGYFDNKSEYERDYEEYVEVPINNEFSIIVPYLNGGLFREKLVTTKDNKKIKESEIYFTGIKDLISTLNKYNWIIGEYEEDDTGSIGTLTPEILGHIYEKFVVGLENIDSDINLNEIKVDNKEIKYGRKKLGAYYTPENIVNYICENTIIPYILDRIKVNTKGNINSFISFFEDYLEEIKNDKAKLKEILKIIEDIKILDPACGSGHFLIGAVNFLFSLKEKIYTLLEEEFDPYQELKKIFVDNIYGVDISENAVEIAKLRLWLKLVRYLKDNSIEPLPNLDYNIKCGNSLIGWLNEGIESSLSLLSQMDDLNRVKLESFLKALAYGMNNKEKREKLNKAGKLLLEKFSLDSYVEAFKYLYEIYKLSYGYEAVVLKDILEDIKNIIYKYVNSAFLEYINKKLKKSISENELYALKPFHWRVDFSWIIKDGGFDIVIGNPPHGAKASKFEKDLWKIIYQLKERGVDSAKIFTERSIQLLKENGYLAFVIPKPSTYSYAWEDFRKFIRKYEITHCINLSKAFESVRHEQIIIALRKKSITKHKYIGGYFDRNEGKIVEIKYLTYDLLPNYILPCDITTKELDIARYLLKKDFSTFSKFDIFRGLPRNLASNYGEPCIKGKEIKRYYLLDPKDFIRLDKIDKNKLLRLKKKKVVTQNIVAHVTKPKDRIIIMSFPDEKGILTFETVTNIVSDKYSVKVISSLLNAKFVSWFVYLFIYNKAIRDMHFDEYFVKNIILPHLNKKISYFLDILTDYMLLLNAKEANKKKYKNIISYFDKQVIDSLVYELYFKEKFYEDGLYPEPKEYLLETVSKHLKPINYDRWSKLYWKKQLENNLTKKEEEEFKELEENNLKTIQEVYETIRNDKEIKKSIEKIKSHEWVKIIENS